VSSSLARLNETRYQVFDTDFESVKARPAIFAFKGDVYIGLDVDSLHDDAILFAQNHVRILSGLYGLLRPLDLIQPYRLEMGTKLKNTQGSNLYEFWGNDLTAMINKDLEESNSQELINLASNEYYKAVHPDQLNASIFTIHFREYRSGELKFVSFNAKKARGYMTNYIVRHQLQSPEDLKNFNDHDYVFNEDLSADFELYFTR